MKITLYNECILNNSYSEVFYNTYLDSYLSTLNNYSFDVDDIFLKEIGEYQIDLDEFNISQEYNKNIIQCNYMKVSTTNQTRYYFINKIAYENGIAILNYTIDVWATYSSGIKIRKAHLNHLLNGIAEVGTKYGQTPIHHEPLEYTSNKPLINYIIRDITPSTYSFGAILFIQTYNTDTIGTATSRHPYMMIECESNTFIPFYTTNVNSLIEYTNQLLLSTANSKIRIGSTNTTPQYFEIVKAYILPKQIIETIKNSTNFGTQTPIYLGDSGTASSYFSGANTHVNETLRTTLQADEHRVRIGTASHQIEISFDGLPNILNLEIMCNMQDFQIIMNVGNELVNIESDFEYIAPFSVEDANAVAQNKVAREIANIKLDNADKYAFQKFLLGAGGSLVQGYGHDDYAGGILSLGSSYINAMYQYATNDLERSQLNLKLYKTNSSVKVNSNIVNISNFAISEFLIDAVNDEQVENARDYIFGYEVDFYITDNELLDFLNDDVNFGDYNILKFTLVQFNGNFSNEIHDIISRILMQGFKIWYTSDPS